jgi:HD-GYP domain-containing protein (c-di-GMP phosphodiesterase class II)
MAGDQGNQPPQRGRGPQPQGEVQPTARVQDSAPSVRSRGVQRTRAPLSDADVDSRLNGLRGLLQDANLGVNRVEVDGNGRRVATPIEGSGADAQRHIADNINDNLWRNPQNETHVQMNQDRAATRVQMEEYFQTAARDLGWSDEAIRQYSEAFVSLLDVSERNGYTTYGHTLRAARYVDMMLIQMAREGINIPPGERAEIRLAALIHDVGKIAVPNDLWRLEGRPSRSQFALMQTHAQQSTNIANRIFERIGLVDAGQFQRISDMAGYHHEHHNGGAYGRLTAEETPLGSAIIALADSYDSMRSIRSYRNSMPHEDAVGQIQKFSGTQFDPELAPIFIRAVEQGGSGPSGGGGGGEVRPGAASGVATATPMRTADATGPKAALQQPAELANFARRLVLHERGTRADATVAAEFNALPKEVQGAVRMLTSDSRFTMNAQGNDALFARYVGNRGRNGGADLLDSAHRSRLSRPEQEAGAMPVRRAVGDDASANVQGTMRQQSDTQTEAATGMARPGPRAMAGDGTVAQVRAGTSTAETAGPVAAAEARTLRRPGRAPTGPREAPSGPRQRMTTEEANARADDLASRLALREDEAEVVARFLEEHPEQADGIEAQTERAAEAQAEQTRVQQAKKAETAGQTRERDLGVLRSERAQAVAARRESPADLEAAYSSPKPNEQTGISARLAKMRSTKGAEATDGRSAVLESMGIEVRDLTPADTEDFFYMVLDGDVEGAVRTMPGYEGATISSVKKSGLGTGTFVVGLSDGRKVFVSPFNGEADVFGARLTTARGIPAIDVTTQANGEPLAFSRIYTGAEGQTVTETRHFNISTDVHNSIGRRVTYRTDDGQQVTGDVTSVADFTSDILSREPGANPKADDAARTFYSMMGTREGMRTLLRRFLIFQENNFRGAMSDLHEGNMYLEVVNGETGPELVFGRFDTDPFGMGLRVGDDGNPDIDLFIGDFTKRTAGIVDKIVDASRKASDNAHGEYNDSNGRPLYDGPEWTRADVHQELLGILMEGDGPLSRTDPRIETNVRQVVQDQVGSQYTMAYSQGTLVGRLNGRSAGMIMVPTEAGGRSIMTPAHADFISGEVLPRLASRVGELRQDNIGMVARQGMGRAIATGEPIPDGIFGDVAANLRGDSRFTEATKPTKGLTADAAATNAVQMQSDYVSARVNLARTQGMDTIELVAQYDSMGTIREWGHNTEGRANIEPVMITVDVESGTIREVNVDGPKGKLPMALSSLEGASLSMGTGS